MVITRQHLRGKTAAEFMAELAGLLADKLRDGDDPSIEFRTAISDNAEQNAVVFEFRANSIPGCFERIKLSTEP